MTKDKSKKNQNSTHRVFIRVNGKRKSKRFLRKADADRWYAEKKREKELLESGVKIERNFCAFEDYANRWLSVRKANGQPLSSYVQEEARLRLYVLPSFGHRNITSITTVEWEKFLDELSIKHGLMSATRNRVRSMLSKLYNDARRQEVVDQNPVSIIPKLKEKSKKWDYWHSGEECSAYLNEAKKEDFSFYIFACIALNTGARIAEVIALDFQDVDLERRRIRIWRIVEDASKTICERTKGFTERWLGINDALYEALHELKAKRGWKRDQPLIIRPNGQRYGHGHIRSVHWRTCTKAQVKPLRVHDLRHTFASHYVMNGGSLAELQGLLGHTSPTMTLKYAHLAPGFLESRAKVVSFASETPNENRSKMKLVISR